MRRNAQHPFLRTAKVRDLKSRTFAGNCPSILKDAATLVSFTRSAHSSDFPLGFGGPDRVRTDDLFHAMEARSQLRHRPIAFILRHENTTPVVPGRKTIG